MWNGRSLFLVGKKIFSTSIFNSIPIPFLFPPAFIPHCFLLLWSFYQLPAKGSIVRCEGNVCLAGFRQVWLGWSRGNNLLVEVYVQQGLRLCPLCRGSSHLRAPRQSSLPWWLRATFSLLNVITQREKWRSSSCCTPVEVWLQEGPTWASWKWNCSGFSATVTAGPPSTAWARKSIWGLNEPCSSSAAFHRTPD